MPGNEVYPPPPEHPRAAHSPSSRSSSSPPSADKADRRARRDGSRSGKNSNRLCTATINRPRAIRATREFRPKPRTQQRPPLSVADHAPFAVRARAHRRRLSPPPCSLSLLSRCLTFFPLHHLILRPDPFPPEGGRLPVVLIDNSRVSVKGTLVCVCVCVSPFSEFFEISKVSWMKGCCFDPRIVFSFLFLFLYKRRSIDNYIHDEEEYLFLNC